MNEYDATITDLQQQVERLTEQRDELRSQIKELQQRTNITFSNVRKIWLLLGRYYNTATHPPVCDDECVCGLVEIDREYEELLDTERDHK